ncbi:MAG: hypothetical protein ABL886_11630 [Rhodoglobus sp.]
MEIWYEFVGAGVEVICDEDESIRTIFLHAGADVSLSELPFGCTREQVLERFGPPSKSGDGTQDPVLGASGAWDRFNVGPVTVHVQYRLKANGIQMITLMRSDRVP